MPLLVQILYVYVNACLIAFCIILNEQVYGHLTSEGMHVSVVHVHLHAMVIVVFFHGKILVSSVIK